MAISIVDFQEMLGVAWGRRDVKYSFFGPGALPLPSYYGTFDAAHPGFYVKYFGSNQSPSTLQSTVGLQAAFHAAAQAWMQVANLDLSHDTANTGDIAVGRIPFQDPPRRAGAAALAFNNLINDPGIRGDIWFSDRNQLDPGNLPKGAIGFFSVIHEIGHALGLKGDEEILNQNYDSWRYSVMSYNWNAFKDANGAPLLIGPGGFQAAPSAPMLYDIAAIQFQYGAKADARLGNDPYLFQMDNHWPIQAIWDAGGNDTIDGGSITKRLYINLDRGGESYVMNAAGGRINGEFEIHIAYQPLGPDGLPDPAYANNFIENAIGGSRDDMIRGNDADNTLEGRKGADIIDGGRGRDILDGGEDNDTLRGGEDVDRYRFTTSNAQGSVNIGDDVIEDADSLGVIEIDGSILSGLFVLAVDSEVPAEYLKKEYRKPGQSVWHGSINGQDVFLYANLNEIRTGTALRIAGPALGARNTITIKNFVSDFDTRNDFGITLDPAPRVLIDTPTTEWREGMALQAGLELSAPAHAGLFARVSINPSHSGLARWVTGAETLAFSPDGTLVIPLATGQSKFMYSLLSVGDADQDAQINLNVTLLDAQGQPIAGSQSGLALNFDATDEPATTSPTPTHTRIGTNQGENMLDVVDPIGTYHLMGLGGDDFLDSASPGGGANSIQGDDLLDGGDGNDVIYAWDGNDRLIGGAGTDKLSGHLGDDVLEGGTESDYLYGGWGRNSLFAETEVTVDQAIVAGEVAPNETGQGDFFHDGAEDSVLIGSNRQDVMGAGGGSDTIVGGGGDDLIAGDSHYYFGWVGESPPDFRAWQWNVTFTDGLLPNGEVFYNFVVHGSVPGETVSATRVITVPGSADVIYAGSGNDGVLAGGGDDFVDGGSGDDIVFGDGGNDTVLGGVGHDVLVGDGEDFEPAGDDFLDGGDGNDRIDGRGGADVLYGGAGNDVITGDQDEPGAGEDYVNGEDGDDRIWGDGKSDILIGGAGNDQLIGDSQETTIAESGDDFLDGGEGDDILVGAGGEDTLIGGVGDDQLLGHGSGGASDDASADYLDGGAGNDLLWGWGGDDQLIGGDGDDQLVGDDITLAAELHGNDQLEGGLGVDALFGLGGDDEIKGGSGNDVLYGGAGDDVLTGGIGADYMRGEAGDDTYIFEYSDIVIVNGTADAVEDSEGYNRIIFNQGLINGNVTHFTSGNAVLQIGPTSDSILLRSGDGSAGVVIRYALTGSIDSFRFTDGVEMTVAQLLGSKLSNPSSQFSDADNASLYGGTSTDTLVSSGSNATMSGGRGNDVLVGIGLGSSTYLFERGDGQDSLMDSSVFVQSGGVDKNVAVLGNDIYEEDISLRAVVGSNSVTLDLGSGDQVILNQFSLSDPLNGPRTLDELRFVDGSVVSWGQLLADRGIQITNSNNIAAFSGTQFNDVITGSAVAETIDSGAGNDVINSGAGNDVLTGGAGHDVINSGAGDDVLTGGIGSDTYVFARGTGRDTILNYDVDVDAFDRVEMAADIAPSQVMFVRGGNDLILKVIGTQDWLTIRDYFGAGALDYILFADGTFYTQADVPLVAANLTATSGDDLLSGTEAAETIDGLAGNDLIYGAGGNDSLTGGAGVDSVYGGTGDDTIVDSDGAADALFGEQGNDTLTGDGTLDGGDGNDILTIAGSVLTTLRGGAGNDFLQGGGSNFESRMDGGEGSDTYFLLDQTSRHVVISQNDTSSGKVDTVRFGPGINPDGFQFGFTADGDLVMTRGSQVSVVIDGFLLEDSNARKIDQFTFDDFPGTVWTAASIEAQLSTPSNANNFIRGTNGADVINALGGDDVVYGLDGDDVIDGGTHGWSWFDFLYGGAGDDTITGDGRLYGEEGNDSLSGIGLLFGGSGNDVLSTVVGADSSFEGGGGSDTFVITRGGPEQVYSGIYDLEADGNWLDADPTSIDVLKFAAGIRVEDVVVRQGGSGLQFEVRGPWGGAERLVDVSGYFNPGNATALIDEVRFTDFPSIVWTHDDILAMVANGTSGDDTLLSGAGNDTLNGLAGNDFIRDQSGDNDFTGGPGNDFLEGGSGNDTYRFGRNQGHDEIRDPYGPNSINTVVFDAGINLSDVAFYRTSGAGSESSQTDDLVVVLNGSSEQLRVVNFFDTSSDSVQISRFQFADGTVVARSTVIATAIDLSGT